MWLISVALFLPFPLLASTLPCWSAASNIVRVGSSPTLQYLLNCGYLSAKPAMLSNMMDTTRTRVLDLSKTGEEGVLEMLVIKEGKCLISKEDLHESYVENLHHSSQVQKSNVSSQFDAVPILIGILVILSTTIKFTITLQLSL